MKTIFTVHFFIICLLIFLEYIKKIKRKQKFKLVIDWKMWKPKNLSGHPKQNNSVDFLLVKMSLWYLSLTS